MTPCSPRMIRPPLHANMQHAIPPCANCQAMPRRCAHRLKSVPGTEDRLKPGCLAAQSPSWRCVSTHCKEGRRRDSHPRAKNRTVFAGEFRHVGNVTYGWAVTMSARCATGRSSPARLCHVGNVTYGWAGFRPLRLRADPPAPPARAAAQAGAGLPGRSGACPRSWPGLGCPAASASEQRLDPSIDIAYNPV
jgi:hypothetical protein